MSGINKFIGIGRTTNEADIRETPSGSKVARFTLAINGSNDDTDFITCVAWNKTAELIEKYVHKGNLIGVEGRVKTGSYIDKDNKKIYTTDIWVNQLQFLEKKGETVETPKTKTDEFMTIPDGIDEELPFK